MKIRTPDTWRDLAACADDRIDPEIFYPHDGDKKQTAEAKAICQGCPVITECLRDALRTEGRAGKAYRHGIRGWYTPAERAKLYRQFHAHTMAAPAAAA